MTIQAQRLSSQYSAQMNRRHIPLHAKPPDFNRFSFKVCHTGAPGNAGCQVGPWRDIHSRRAGRSPSQSPVVVIMLIRCSTAGTKRSALNVCPQAKLSSIYTYGGFKPRAFLLISPLPSPNPNLDRSHPRSPLVRNCCQ